jgi:hypothetical protein
MLSDEFENFEKGAPVHARLHELLGNGIFNTDGESTRISRLFDGAHECYFDSGFSWSRRFASA